MSKTTCTESNIRFGENRTPRRDAKGRFAHTCTPNMLFTRNSVYDIWMCKCAKFVHVFRQR